MPGRTPPDVLKDHVSDLTEQMAAVGKEKPKVIVLGHLPVDEPNAAREMVEAYEDAGATGIAHFSRYADGTEFNAIADTLANVSAIALNSVPSAYLEKCAMPVAPASSYASTISLAALGSSTGR